MTTVLRHTGYIILPSHIRAGGFDHAAVHGRTGHVYVAHTANDAVDVIDPAAGRHIFSIAGLPGVAGVLVCDEWRLVITSNRAENTIGITRFRARERPSLRLPAPDTSRRRISGDRRLRGPVHSRDRP